MRKLENVHEIDFLSARKTYFITEGDDCLNLF